ncbi:hypothetical protein BT69DRAFT_1331730 [Atractiella rhizophila]|nr:hypothetical protein BT69DRAFT_1331730 [Atractiella rhizophila]
MFPYPTVQLFHHTSTDTIQYVCLPVLSGLDRLDTAESVMESGSTAMNIPGYACLKTLITASGSMPYIANARPSSVNDISYQDGLKAFATLWKELQASPSSVPEAILHAHKAYLCAATEHIHAILLPEGLTDPIGPDGAFIVNERDQHQEEEEDARLEPDPIDIKAAEIAEILPLKIDGSKKDNKRRKLRST